MSYCRCGEDSDVYLFYSGKYEFHISNTASKALSGFTCDTASEALSKLLELRDDGLKVPDCAIRRLRAEVTNAEIISAACDELTKQAQELNMGY